MSNNSLLCVDRMVLESISRKNGSIMEICNDTKLSIRIIQNTIFNLRYKNIVSFDGVKYFINRETSAKWKKEINSNNYVKEEVKDLFSSLVNNYFENSAVTNEETNFKMKKVWLSDEEDRIFQTLLGNIKSFFDGVQEKRKENNLGQSLSKQKVVFWGHSNYLELVEGVLESI